ncbi:MAG: phosphate starvation-inducible protein PhoH [Bacteroidetes bacterium 4572_112]|nr:MAG: phosphate starvation-inducible protein PhoH [Bacteroidetes bacterium 4572_112]
MSNEIIIKIDSANPVDFFGVNHINLKFVESGFPELKIIARGEEIKAYGNSDSLKEFEWIINNLLETYNLKGIIRESDIKTLLGSTEQESNTRIELEKNTQVLVYGRSGRVIKARTKNQQLMVDSIQKNDMLFAIGPAGTGKTYTAVALAVKALKNREVRRIVLTRPAIEAGESLGFLPGDMKDKLDPYMQPLYDALRDMLPESKLEKYFEERTIEIAPLAFMRGRTLDHAFVILDEAQNTTSSQLKMFLTRMGKDAKFVITGDITQIDLPKNQHSGLLQAERILHPIKGIKFVKLDQTDVVRHKIVTKIINAYSNI